MSGLNTSIGMGRRPVLVAQTSLQLVLAAALAEESRVAGAPTARLVFVPDLVNPDLFRNACAAWEDPPFAAIDFLEPRRQAGGRTSRPWSALHDELTQLVKDSQPTSVTVFNDRQDIGQCVLIAARRYWPTAMRQCAEDGALAYTGYTYRRLGVVTRLRQRLRLGPDWVDVRVLGTHPLVQEFVALHPHLLRPELRHMRVRPFPSTLLAGRSLQKLAHVVSQAQGWTPARLSDGTVLLALNHSSYAQRNPGYVELIKTSVHHLKSSGVRCLFKYHPREAQDDYLTLRRAWPSGEIPRALPMESVYLLAQHHRMLVLGGVGTSLLTAALLLPRARCVALATADQAMDRWEAPLTSALGLLSAPDASAVASLVHDWTSTAGT